MLNKITFCIIPDIFQPEISETINVDFVENQTIESYLIEILNGLDGLDIKVSLNGKHCDLSITPESGDFVSVVCSPQAAAITTLITGASSISAAFGWGGVLGAIAYGAVYIAASYLVMTGMNMILKAIGLLPSQSELTDDQSSPTYAWGDLQPSVAEGLPIPMVYGEHKIAGQIINQFVTVKDSKEYLNVLLAVNDGLVDSIDDIRINNQPYNNYNGVSVYTRLGALDQTAIGEFDEISQQHNPNVKLTYNNSFSYQTAGDSVEKLAVIIKFPNGLSYSNDDGGLDSRSVQIKIEYRIVGSGSWIVYDIITVTGRTTEERLRTVEIDDLSPDQYEVQLTRMTSDDDSFRENTDSYFSTLIETVKQELSYPGVALYGIKALATDQLSGAAPTFTCNVTKSSVSVYNPYTSLWESEDADNPAWMLYDFLVNHHNISHEAILYDDFNDWANYCNELVNGEYRFRAAIVLDTQNNIWDNAQKIAALGQATLIRRGTYYGLFVDKPETTISHLFTSGNIIEDSFQLKYLPVADRANAVEVTYCDPDRDFTNQIAAVYSSDYMESESEDKKTSVQIFAAITRERAFQYAARTLNSNRFLTKTATFKAFTDSFSCTIGDLTYFQHDIPHYDKGWGGRIVSATENTVTIDREVTLSVGTTYNILVRLSDDTFVEKTVEAVTEETTTSTLTLTSSFTTEPSKDDLYMFGIASTYKETYRIIQISSDEDGIRTITALEYNDDVYYGDDYTVIEDDYSPPVEQEAINVTARERLVYGAGGDYQSVVDVNWIPNTISSGSNWSIYVEDLSDGNSVINKIADTTYTKFQIGSEYLIIDNEFKIYIAPYGKGAYDTGSNTTTLTIQGKLNPPADVSGFSGEWENNLRSVNFTWSAVTDIDLAGYEIRRGDTDWESSDVVAQVGKTTSHTYLVPVGTVADLTYRIKAFDTSGVFSENDTTDVVSIDTSETDLEVPTGLALSSSVVTTNDGSQSAMLFADWNSNAELVDTFKHYVVRLEEIATGKVTEYVTQTSEFSWILIANTEYGVQVQAVDALNNRTAFCSQVTETTPVDEDAPSVPTWDLVPLVPGFKVMFVSWNAVTDKDLSHYEIQRSEDDFDEDIQTLGEKKGTFTTDTDLDVSTEYFYRVRSVDTSGNASAWSSVESATTTQVGSADIAANSVNANHINVTSLSAIAANVGTLTAGVLESDDWDTDAGFQIDLGNGTIKAGGSANPIFEWDGSELTISSVDGDNEMILSGAEMTLGNTDDGDYFQMTSGDIFFYRYINSDHRLAKSLKRVDTGTAENGEETTLTGYWKVYKFTPRIELSIASGSATQNPNESISISYSSATKYGTEYSLPSSVTQVFISGKFVITVPEVAYFSHNLYVIVDGTTYDVSQSSGALSGDVTIPFTKTVSGLTGSTHTVQLKLIYSANEISGNCVLQLYSYNLSSSSVLAEGTCSYLAIGE